MLQMKKQNRESLSDLPKINPVNLTTESELLIFHFQQRQPSGTPKNVNEDTYKGQNLKQPQAKMVLVIIH